MLNSKKRKRSPILGKKRQMAIFLDACGKLSTKEIAKVVGITPKVLEKARLLPRYQTEVRQTRGVLAGIKARREAALAEQGPAPCTK